MKNRLPLMPRAIRAVPMKTWLTQNSPNPKSAFGGGDGYHPHSDCGTGGSMSKPNFTADDFADIFEQFFSGKQPNQNGDFDLTLPLTIQEAMQGVAQKTVTYKRLIPCPTCE